MDPLISLDQGHVDLWVIAADDPRIDIAFPKIDAALLSDERTRIDRIISPPARREQTLTRVFLRRLLSRYARVPERAWRFDVNAHGRPEICAPSLDASLDFNLSHTAGMIVCLVGRERILGVDVETSDRARRVLDIAKRFFSPAEARALRDLPPHRQLDRFLAYWTLKEAYIKARGMGLALPLHHFSFHLDETLSIRLSFDAMIDDNPARWHFVRSRPTDRHHLAVALRCNEGETLPTLRERDALPLLLSS